MGPMKPRELRDPSVMPAAGPTTVLTRKEARRSSFYLVGGHYAAAEIFPRLGPQKVCVGMIL